MDDSLRVYFAGDIFNHKDLVGNLLLADAIKSVSDGRYHCIPLKTSNRPRAARLTSAIRTCWR